MIEALSAALRERDVAGEARAAVARCVEIVRAQQQDFLSEQYATPQPLGSFAERFACGQCIDAIMNEFAMGSNEQRVLVGRPTHGEEYRAALHDDTVRGEGENG